MKWLWKTEICDNKNWEKLTWGIFRQAASKKQIYIFTSAAKSRVLNKLLRTRRSTPSFGLGRRYDIRTRSKRWKISLFFVVSLDIRQYACDFTPWKVKIFQALLSSKNFFKVNFSQYKEKTQLIPSYLRVFWRSNTGNSPKKTGSDIATSA